jgi:hypothetical protein
MAKDVLAKLGTLRQPSPRRRDLRAARPSAESAINLARGKLERLNGHALHWEHESVRACPQWRPSNVDAT